MKALATAMVTLGAIAVATPTVAQEGQVTESSVRSFFKDTMRQAEKAVAGGDWQGVRDWAQRHLADEATLALKGAIVSKKGPVLSYAGSLDREDLLGLGAATMMSLQDLVESFQDYSLETTVQSVSVLPNGEATAIVHFQEMASIDPSQLRGDMEHDGEQVGTEERSPASADEQGDSSKAVVQSTSACNFRLSNGGEDGMQIEIAACETTTTF
jgi:hypothetical protein